jgi:gamma-glutamyl-gamma-aminobutyrate hydrolase PuuD
VVAVKRKPILGYSPWAYFGAQPFNNLFGGTQNCVVQGFQGIDCFLLNGGTDIGPEYYKEKTHPKTFANDKQRDHWEWKAMAYCRRNNIPMIGICRGAQFLCIANGGSLIQDVSAHSGASHSICTVDGEILLTNSLHHQMMNPFETNHKILAWAAPSRSSWYEDGNGDDVKIMAANPEPEIVYFPDIKGIGIQGHPEYTAADSKFKEYCVQVVNDYLLESKA